ncbi:hypothetical protein LA345_36530 (plasmid) [Burkholderia vietnamiensis]|uniref:Uncharacterized protein n=1 Tax=Burkholderia vietnamiensis (strain G4 / LMG 22486) TaxID=269482 RepID=A4JVS9_BURVG|nr:hypothetical protein Bcep1808_7507 [Burkholderia vietnamiensis G4]MCB4349319.1 hypothetical protein [Burkholderia vietnamiensis]
MRKPPDRPVQITAEDVLSTMAQLGRDATVSEAEALASNINSAGLPDGVARDIALREMLAGKSESDLQALSAQDHPRLAFARVREILASHGEAAAEHQVGHYSSLSTLAETVRSSKCWSEGEIFSCALDETRFVIMKQVAPASCEMVTVSHMGFHDVLTAYRYDQQELVDALNGYIAPAAAEIGHVGAAARDAAKPEFLFDLQLDASIRFRAQSETIAREELRRHLDCANANLGEILGQTIVCEVSLNGTPALAEVDGVEPDNATRPVLFQSDPRPIVSLDPNRPLYDDAGREHQLISASRTQVVTTILGVYGVWDRATGECLMTNAEGTRLSNEAPSPEWVAARRQAAGEVLASMHADAAIKRARGDDSASMEI